MTAVEWLVEEVEVIYNSTGISRIEIIELYNKAIEQAKEMENEQMEITWNNAIDAQLKDKWDSYDDFYNTTFKSE